jgi:hypothetical protein
LEIDTYTWETVQMLGETHHLEHGVRNQSSWHAFLEDHKPELEALFEEGDGGLFESPFWERVSALKWEWLQAERVRRSLARPPYAGRFWEGE